MRYESLIRDAWTMTWRYRYLWILGLFASSSVGSCSGRGAPVQWQGTSADLERLPPSAAAVPGEVGRWVEGNLGLLVAAGVVVLLLGLIVLVISFIAQGAMARATADLARGREMSLGAAWRAGVHLFWRYLGLTLVLVLVAIVVAAVLGAVAVLLIVVGNFRAETPRWVVLPLLLFIGLPVLAAVVVAAVLASIVVAYAQRAIAVEDDGPLAALAEGIRLLRGHPGASLLVWLLNVALSIVAGIAVAVIVALAAVLLGLLGVLLWAVAGFTTPTFVYIALGVATVLAGAWALGGITNTFFWHYWTLAYLRLRHPEQPATGAG